MNEQETDQLITQYLKYCRYEKGLSEKTIKAYRIDLTQFSIYLGKPLLRCDKGNIQSYLSEVYGQYKVKSVKRKIASLKAFYNYLESEDIIELNPFTKLRVKLHEPFLLPKTIPLKSIDLILQCAYKKMGTNANVDSYSYKSNLRDIAVLELLFATGMRVSELCTISGEMIDLNNVGYLVGSVVDIKGDQKKTAILDLSAICHIPDIVFSDYEYKILGGFTSDNKEYAYILAGPTCYAGDIFGEFSFEQPLSIGSKIIICDTAHYTTVKSSMFNGISLPSIVLYSNRTSVQLKRVYDFNSYLSIT